MINTNNPYYYGNSLFCFQKPANVIIGATAKIDFDSMGHDPMFYLNGGGNVVLYPGCEINTHGEDKEVITSNGTLYLTKYASNHAQTDDYKKIRGKISKDMKIVFPTTTNTDMIFKCNQDYIKHFPYLNWIGNNYDFHDYGNDFNRYDNDLSV